MALINEVPERTDLEDNVVNHIEAAKDILGQAEVANILGTDQAPNIVDNPTELIPAVVSKIPVIAFIIAGVLLIYFLFKRK